MGNLEAIWVSPLSCQTYRSPAEHNHKPAGTPPCMTDKCHMHIMCQGERALY